MLEEEAEKKLSTSILTSQKNKVLNIMDSNTQFIKAKNSLVRKLGRDPLDNFQIDEVGKAWFGVKWGFVSDQSKTIPKTPDRYYIVNTAHSNKSPGYHWTALYISKSARPYIYDSFARNIKALMPVLEKNIKGRGVGVNSNGAEQHSQSSLCGHISLAWLHVVKNLGIREASKI